MLGKNIGLILLVHFLLIVASVARAADHAVVIMYHRFGEDRYPSTNTTLSQFDKHLDELATGGYTVMPLIEITERIAEGRELPDKTVAITVDDAFASVYREAFPRLQDYGFPFTVFIATRSIDRNLPGYASWDEIREMQAAGVHFGSQTHSHPHLHRVSLDEARQEISTSNDRFLEELGMVPPLHAYPYGEFSPGVRDLMKDMGFKAAFGQHSGVMHGSQNPFEYPRFGFNENYGSIDRLKLAINALPIPSTDQTPDSMVLNQNPPIAGFTVLEGIEPLHRIACFASGMGKVKTITLGRRVEVRLPSAINGKRGRINCTMPHVVDGRETGRWRWLGRQFVQP